MMHWGKFNIKKINYKKIHSKIHLHVKVIFEKIDL
jgi:hypothetical protein